jgi:hypothetical protein
MSKFGRNYLLSVETKSGLTITIEPPFTIDIDVQRDTLSSVNITNIRVYNLSEKNRNQIRKDAWNFDDIRNVVLKVGYGNQISTVAVGNIKQAWSAREGVDFITTIETYDGGWAFTNAQSDFQVQAGTPKRSVVLKLAENMNNFGVTTGAIGAITGEVERGNTYSGPTVELMKELVGDSFFIDNGKVNVLSSSESISSSVLTVNSASGLLGTPIRENTYLRFDMIFEPKIQVGTLINLESSTGKNFNGIHKVYSLKHKGMISDSVGGKLITTVGLLDGNFNPIESAGL